MKACLLRCERFFPPNAVSRSIIETGGSSPLEFWKAAIYSGLEVQLASAEAWKAWVCANEATVPEITVGACQTLYFVEDWMRTQMQLWESWFAALESLAPGAANQPAEAGQQAPKPRTHQHPRPAAARVGQVAGNSVPA